MAARALQGRLPARAYRDAESMTARRAVAIRIDPQPRAEQLDQLLVGEIFDVLEAAGDWVYGQARRDGYVGWARVDDLAVGTAPPTHRVAALRSLALAEPTPRAAGLVVLALNALVTIESLRDGFAQAVGLGWIPLPHLVPIGRFETDPAAVAERFAGSPYLWGGRDGDGIDCSGLVQQALYACGRACPRDSDQQALMGVPVAPAALRRNDLVCWPGHIGVMADGDRLIHASGLQMAVVVEALADAVAARIATAGAPTTFRRLSDRPPPIPDGPEKG